MQILPQSNTTQLTMSNTMIINHPSFRRNMRRLPWSVAYAPKDTKDVVVASNAVEKILSHLDGFKSKKRKGILLHGPTGSGKSSLVYAIAEERNAEILEFNASDKRNKASMKELLGSSTKQASLFGNSKIILIDEVDSLSGTHDRGGASELASIIKESTFPIIMTAQDPWDSKLSKVRSASTLIEIPKIENGKIKEVLMGISDKESIGYDGDALGFISRISDGDIRAAINDMQASVVIDKISKDSITEDNHRDSTSTIPQVIRTILKSEDMKMLKDSLNNFDGNLDDVFMWLDYNIPKEYEDPESLSEAYEYLSMTDIYNSRIRRWQYWRFLAYTSTFMGCGVGKAKKMPNKRFVKYEQNSRILKIWMSKRKYAKRESIAEKIAKRTHWSKQEVIKNFGYYRAMSQDKEFLKRFAEEVDLEKDEVSYLSAK